MRNFLFATSSLIISRLIGIISGTVFNDIKYELTLLADSSRPLASLRRQIHKLFHATTGVSWNGVSYRYHGIRYRTSWSIDTARVRWAIVWCRRCTLVGYCKGTIFQKSVFREFQVTVARVTVGSHLSIDNLVIRRNPLSMARTQEGRGFPHFRSFRISPRGATWAPEAGKFRLQGDFSS